MPLSLPLSSEMPLEALVDAERMLWASQRSHYSSPEGFTHNLLSGSDVMDCGQEFFYNDSCHG